jgi:cytochrome c biogenesis protein CcmG/thiol:disulfide interchange protein DsbE
MARRSRLFGWTLATVALVPLVLVGLLSGGSSLTGRRAPRLPREQLAGPPVTLAGLTTASGGGAPASAHATLVTFWASWCVPCAREAPALERFSLSPSGQGRLVGVDSSDGLSEARSFIRRYSWTFSNLRDSEGTVGNDYHLAGLPMTFVLDASAHICAVLRGPQNESSLARALASVGHSAQH